MHNRSMAKKMKAVKEQHSRSQTEKSDAMSYGLRSIPQGRGERIWEAEAAW